MVSFVQLYTRTKSQNPDEVVLFDDSTTAGTDAEVDTQSTLLSENTTSTMFLMLAKPQSIVYNCSFPLLSPTEFWSNFYLGTWLTLNVIITLYCKAIFSIYRFPYPMLITCIHMFFTTLGVFGCQLLGLYTPKSPAPEMRLTILLFSIVFTMNIWLSNASLMAVSVNLHQVVRTIIPFFTMGISLLFFHERYSVALLPPVLLIVVGVALTIWGDLDFTLFGFVVVLIGCFCSSLKGIITQRTQLGALGLSSLDLLRYLCPLAIGQLLLLALFMGEVRQLTKDPNIGAPLAVHLVLLGWVAFGLNFVSFRCAALLNPLTLNVAGNVKQVLTCLLSTFVLGGVFSAALYFGILGTAIGAYWYSREMGEWKSRNKMEAVQDEDLELQDQLDDSTTSSKSGDSPTLRETKSDAKRSRSVIDRERR